MTMNMSKHLPKDEEDDRKGPIGLNHNYEPSLNDMSVWDDCIINNDKGNFYDRTKPDDSKPAESISERLVDRSVKKERNIEPFDVSGPSMIFSTENNNIMVMCRLYSNVLIRWDKDFSVNERTTLKYDDDQPSELDPKK